LKAPPYNHGNGIKILEPNHYSRGTLRPPSM
jgi:hypothetical protein